MRNYSLCIGLLVIGRYKVNSTGEDRYGSHYEYISWYASNLTSVHKRNPYHLARIREKNAKSQEIGIRGSKTKSAF